MTTSNNHPPIGLALSGGGIRGLAHIGVLKVLEREGIQPVCVAGTSMGSMVGALYATGRSATELEAEAIKFSGVGHIFKFIDWLPSWRGLMRGQSISNYLERLLGEDITFEELPIKLGITATDLVAKEAVHITSGSVADAIRASLSLAGIFTPVEREGQRLVDGGFLNHLPVDLARSLGADVLIAVDVQAVNLSADSVEAQEESRAFLTTITPPFMVDMMQVNNIMVREITRLRLEAANPEILLTPTVPSDVGAFAGLEQADRIIKAGEEAAEAALPKLYQILQ